MAAGNTSTINGYNATVDIDPYLIVKPGANDYDVALGAASTDELIGVSGSVKTLAGQTCDVTEAGPAFVKLGGNVTRGDLLTSDANGKAIAAAPAAGVNARVIGHARVSGVLDDVIPAVIGVGRIQG